MRLILGSINMETILMNSGNILLSLVYYYTFEESLILLYHLW